MDGAAGARGAPPGPWLGRALGALLLAAVTYHAGSVAWIVAHRVGYPFELEWLEGDEFHHALRILHGRSWYPAPSLDFFPEIYPPGYPAICAPLLAVWGGSLTAMRVVSLLATLAALAAMVWTVRRQTGSMLWGLVSAGLFLAAYDACGAWFDVARADMLALALALVGVALAAGTNARPLAAVAFLALSTLVKQTSIPLLAGTVAVWLVWDWRRGLRALGAAILWLGVPVALLQWQSAGWFWFYTVSLASTIPHHWSQVASFWGRDVPALAGLALPVVVAACADLRRRERRRRLELWLLPAALLISLAGRINPGGFTNNLLPAAAFLALATGFGLDVLARAGHRLRPVLWLAQALVLAQFLVLRHDFAADCPRPADVAAGWAVVEKIRQLPGPVLAPYEPYLLHLSGHEMNAQFHMLNELLGAKDRGAKLDDNGMLLMLEQQAAAGRWRSFVSSEHASLGEFRGTWVDGAARRYFHWHAALLPADDKRTLYPPSGNPVRPCAVYRPRASGDRDPRP